MDVISYIRQELNWANDLLERTMDGVTSEEAHWQPPGLANPLAAVYAHAVFAQDAVVQVVLRGEAPLFATLWSGRTGSENPQWGLEQEWGRQLRIDLASMRVYARAVFAASADFLATLTDGDLDRVVDLSSQGMGRQTVGWVLAALVVSHVNNMTGEISCLKGLQGARGYPY